MLKKLLPLVLLLIGTGAGIGAALVLAPPGADDHASEDNEDHAPTGGGGESHVEPPDETHSSSQIPVSAPDSEFFKMTGQFVVPLVKDDRVTSMIVLSLSLETGPNLKERMHAREPKLRDLFLRVLFDHASMGGFRGSFTQAGRLDLLRGALREVARKEMGNDIRDVLITDIGRQDS